MSLWFVTEKDVSIGDTFRGYKVIKVEKRPSATVLIGNTNAREWDRRNPAREPSPLEPEVPLTWAQVTTIV